MHEHRQSGFTLLELLVAVAVFCILAALAIPSFTTYMDKSRLRGAADDVVSTIAQARQAAVKFDRDISLATTGEGDTWCLGANEAIEPTPGDQAAAAEECDCTASPVECKVEGADVIIGSAKHPGITLASPAEPLMFDGRLGLRTDDSTGDADESSFNLTSRSGAYTVTIRVTPLGHATVCSANGNILGYPAC